MYICARILTLTIMKISFKSAFVAIASIALFLSSCTTSIEVAKRKHRKGYHVSITKNKTEKSQLNSAEFIELAAVDSPSVDTVKIEPMILDQATELAVIDSPTVDTLKTDKVLQNFKNMISSNEEVKSEKLSFVQKVKAVNKVRKQFKKLRKDEGFKAASSDEDWEIDSDVMFILMLLLAWVLPPAAVLLVKGKDSGSFKLNFILWIIGVIGLGASLAGFGLGWLAMLLAIIHAFLVVLGHAG